MNRHEVKLMLIDLCYLAETSWCETHLRYAAYCRVHDWPDCRHAGYALMPVVRSLMMSNLEGDLL